MVKNTSILLGIKFSKSRVVYFSGYEIVDHKNSMFFTEKITEWKLKIEEIGKIFGFDWLGLN